MTHIFAISGSLRNVSTNTALVRRYAELSRTICTVDVYDQLELLLPFNPDIEEPPNGIVLDFVARVRAADAFVVATPEYAHGLPGALKNSLDWLVGTDAFIDKPFAILTACPRSKHAASSLF